MTTEQKIDELGKRLQDAIRERDELRARLAQAEKPYKISLKEALQTLTEAIGVYGDRLAGSVELHWDHGVSLHMNHAWVTSGIDDCSREISRINEQEAGDLKKPQPRKARGPATSGTWSRD
jgi:hypothetical protein